MRLKPILMAGVTTLALSGLSFATGNAAQQQKQTSTQQQVSNQKAAQSQTDKVDLVTWAQEDLYSGWTADQLFDTDVYGQDGEQAGEVENLLIGPDGQIRSLIVESGGFLDIGDTEYAVPWDKVEVGQDMERVTVPVTADNISKFSVFPEDREGERRGFRATELMGDYVSLKDVAGYGLVRDLVFDDTGQLQAVVVSPDVAYGVGGPYAYPYYGYRYGWQPGSDYYHLPYTRTEISELGPFDYSKLKNPMAGPEAKIPPAQEQG